MQKLRKELAEAFNSNFEQFSENASQEILNAAPKLPLVLN